MSYARRSGSQILIGGDIALMVVAAIGIVWAIVPPWGGRRIWRFGLWLYGSEGQAGEKEPSRIARPWWSCLLMPLTAAAFMAQFALTIAGWLPVWMAQPISALFFTPLCVAMYRVSRPVGGAWLLVAPAIYLAFGFLVLAGAPVASNQLSKFWLNIFVPLPCAQVLAMIASHFYSRYALRKVQSLAHMDMKETTHG
jgi:hypothetical protein